MEDDYQEALRRIEKARRQRATRLSLWGSELEEVPAEIGQLVNLHELDLNGNQLNSLPAEIGQLVNLHELDLSGNQLSILPAEIGQLVNLQELNLGGNQLSILPVEIGQLVNLQKLNLRGNQLSILPIEIGQLVDLQEFDLSGNRLSSLPAEIGHLVNLQKIYLNENQLVCLPAEIFQLVSLGVLELSTNQLSSLPAEIFQLMSLRILGLSDNQLTSFPTEIYRLMNLRALNLGANQLTTLPAGIDELRNLTRLDLSNNHLSTLPKGIKKLEKLYQEDGKLNITNNHFDIAEEMYKKAPAELVDYLIELEKSKKPLHEAKVIFVGNANTGKTSLVKKLMYDTFDPKEAQTEGIRIEDWKLCCGKNDIRLYLWDFGGQEIMHANHKFFMTRRSVYVIVVEPRTEDQQGDTPLNYWLTLVQSYAADSPIVVVVNKYEGNHKIDIPKRELILNFPQIVDVVYTSCKEDRGINELKMKIEEALADLKHLNDAIPGSYFRVKEKLQQVNRHYIDYEQYRGLCRRIDPGFSEVGMKGLVGLLNDLGIMLNIADNRRLDETQVLNPAWLTNGVYRVINSKEMKERQGRLTFDEIAFVLKNDNVFEKGKTNWMDRLTSGWKTSHHNSDYSSSKAQNIVVDMMEHFSLCYRLPDHRPECFLFPAALPADIPGNLKWEHKDVLKFQYHYKTMPSSIIATFLVRVLNLRRGSDYWRNGIIIKDAERNNEAYIRADDRNKQILIEVAGKGDKRAMLYFCIRKHLDTIHDTFSKKDLGVEELIPYSDGEKEALIPYEDLKICEEEGEEQLFVPALRKRVNVKQVLNGIDIGVLDKQLIKKLKDEIRKNNLKSVIGQLIDHAFVKNTGFERNVILISREWEDIDAEIRGGTVNRIDAGLRYNGIANRLLSVIERLEKEL